MSDFLGRLANRTLGVAQVARPILPSAYAPQPEPESRGFVETREFVDDEGTTGDVDRHRVSGAPRAAGVATASRGARPGAAAPSAGHVSGKPEHEAVRAGPAKRGVARGQAAAARVTTAPADAARPAAARRGVVVESTSAIVAPVAPTRVPLGRRGRAAASSVDSAVPVARIRSGPAAENLSLPANNDVGPNGRSGSPRPAAEATVLPRATASPTRRTQGDLVVDTVGAGTSVPALRDSIARRRSVGDAAPDDAATITVTIGRVEVRSPAPPAPQQPATPPWKPLLSLDEFLARRPDR